MAETAQQIDDIQAYRREKLDMVCEVLKTSDLGIRRICDAFRKDDPSFPAARTIRNWMDDDDNLRATYARAKELQADHIFDEIIEIADTPVIGEQRTEKANGDIEVKYGDMLGRSQLRIDARKWVVSKLLPKKYGDLQRVEHDISDNLAEQLRLARERRQTLLEKIEQPKAIDHTPIIDAEPDSLGVSLGVVQDNGNDE